MIQCSGFVKFNGFDGGELEELGCNLVIFFSSDFLNFFFIYLIVKTIMWHF